MAHNQMVAVLTGETGEAVSVSGGTVQLNLAPVIDAVKERLVDAGFTLASRIPAVTTEITLFQSEGLARAQTAFRLLDTAARALPIIALILLGAAVAVSRRRRRTLTIGAIVIAASMVLLGAALNFFRIAYLDAIPSDRIPADAAAVIFDQLVEFIRLNLRALLVISLAVAFVAWVSGPERAPVRVRQGVSRALDSVRHRRDSAGLGTGPVGEFLYNYHTPLRVLVLGGAVLVYVLADHPTGAWTLGVVAVAGLILLVVELLAGGPPRPRRGCARRLSRASRLTLAIAAREPASRLAWARCRTSSSSTTARPTTLATTSRPANPTSHVVTARIRPRVPNAATLEATYTGMTSDDPQL